MNYDREISHAFLAGLIFGFFTGGGVFFIINAVFEVLAR